MHCWSCFAQGVFAAFVTSGLVGVALSRMFFGPAEEPVAEPSRVPYDVDGNEDFARFV